MLHAIWLLATEEAAEESSKAAFYIAGLVLAGWAVGLSVAGLRNPKLAGSATEARPIIAISVALVVITVATAVLTG